MNHLRAVNVEKSFSIIRDFFDFVAVEEVNPELEEKKQMAEKALDHLNEIYGAEKGNDEPKNPGRCTKEGCGTNLQR